MAKEILKKFVEKGPDPNAPKSSTTPRIEKFGRTPSKPVLVKDVKK
jgi:hypothetical protein